MPEDAGQAWRIGNFQVVRLLGEGAMGTVYLGAHDTLHRKVAIKILHPQLAATPQLVDRFIDEARSVSALGHPTLVQIFDFGRLPDGRLYSVMEYLDGSDLAQALAKGGPFAPARAAKIVADVAAGLAIVHDAGIVHRDLKPENLYLARTAEGGEQVKILDFGIAKLLDLDGGGSARRTSAGSVLGTPAYLSPEQAKAGPVDARADQYSLGIVLYELLAGRPPFRSQNPMELLMAHALEPAPPLGPLAPGAPPALVAVAERCLAKEPAQRFPHMRDLRNAVLAAMGMSGTQADGALAVPPRSTVVPAQPGPSRLPLVAGVALALVAAGGAAFALFGGGTSDVKPPKPTPTAPSVREPLEKPAAATPDAAPALSSAAPKNPFAPDDKAVLAGGEAIYISKCARCHGEKGMGDGPDTPTGLEPKAFADSAVYPGELDVYRFNIIKHGIAQEKDGDYAMPSFAIQLTDAEIWQVVTYLGKLSAPAAQAVEAAPREPKPDLDDALADEGKKLFGKKCVSCHGQNGKGNGRAAEYLARMPADLTKGSFKLRSTPKGELPTDEDLFRTVTVGMGVGGMPGFAKLPERDRWALVAYVKTLSRDFAAQRGKTPEVLKIGTPPPGGPVAVEAGRIAFKNAGCTKCHGESGRGDGPRAGKSDDWKKPIAPPDFTQRFTFIGGTEPTDVYRTMMTGISGTAMPEGDELLDEEDAWKVVYFILSLSGASK
jgi:cbb3-type cytochrome c oxidase subunit III